ARNECPARGVRGEPALGRELAARRDHGVAMHAERARETARAGNGVARAQPATADVVGDPARDLEEQRRAVAALDRQNQVPGPHDWSNSYLRTGPFSSTSCSLAFFPDEARSERRLLRAEQGARAGIGAACSAGTRPFRLARAVFPRSV